MRIDILTLFPDMFAPLNMSILGRAIEKNIINIQSHDIREWSTDNHKKCDDYPFGGGAGMVMTPQPICDLLDSIITPKSRLIYMSPRGSVLSQNMAKNIAKNEHLIILCGHYEGVDQRVLNMYNFEEISIGDYVLTGGELPAMVLIDTVSRMLEGVIKSESAFDESHSAGLLEYDQYTRPAEYRGVSVPDVLISGNHAKIDAFRAQNAIKNTKKNRLDMYNKFINKGE